MNDKEEEMREALKVINQDQQLVLNYSDFISTALNLQKYLQEEKLWTLYR